MVEKTCKFCGVKFEAKRVTAEFCSDNHRVQWNKKKLPTKIEKEETVSLSNFKEDMKKIGFTDKQLEDIAKNSMPKGLSLTEQIQWKIDRKNKSNGTNEQLPNQ